MRILLLTPGNPFDHKSWSGTLRSITTTIQNMGHKVLWHGKIPRASLFLRIKNILYNLFNGKKYRWQHSIEHSKKIGKIISARIEDMNYDLILAIVASTESAFVNINSPIIYISDATFDSMVNYEKSFSNISSRSIEEGNYLEKKILQRSTYILYPSDWPINSALKYYGISEKKIIKAKFGPNLPNLPKKYELKDINIKQEKILKLLFVGVKWNSKGGPIAIEALNELNKRGINTELTIVGCKPKGEKCNGLIIKDFLDKSNEQDLKCIRDLYYASHLLILPTRNEAVGIVFAESAAFGLPCVASNTGGIPDYIEDNITGRLLELSANGKDYADVIENIWNDKVKYNKMKIASRKKYEQELNWTKWGEQFQLVLDKINNGIN
ncbi:MAG: glycosyltransferase family 4 protein [Pelagibacterales bacterium]|nr:glycosyltransferase family 4 protein [Pelagibacterales bacterium]